MDKNNMLLEGPILKSLVKLAIPIMGTSFVQMAYSLTDMIWLGRVGSEAVAAVGTAGFFVWLASAFIFIPRIGAEVGVAQSVGGGDKNEANSYIRHSLQMIIFLGFLYGLVLIIFRKPMIGFFNLPNAWTVSKSINYLVIVSLGMVFYFINPVFTGIYNGYGDSKTPFTVNVIGLVVNMLFDPLLIFGIGPFPKLGVEGAAIATIFAQICVTLVFIFVSMRRKEIFKGIEPFKSPDVKHVARIAGLGFPVALQSGIFTMFAMIIARIVARWGETALAVQSVGSQIESISWLTAGGFQTALSTYVGQNYGAGKWDRIYKGYYAGIFMVSIAGIFSTCLLIFGARPLFALFLPEKEAIGLGISYLQVLGLSQLFMCIEISTAGAFNGLGKTVPPSIVGIGMNAMRIPGALILSASALGLNGVWWSISLSSIAKGSILFIWFVLLFRRREETAELRILRVLRPAFKEE